MQFWTGFPRPDRGRETALPHFVPQEFQYRLGWRAQGARPGAHMTRTPGGVADFRGYANFLDHPDPRRIDVRATLGSIPRRLMVRSYHERGAITVYAIVDLSASMSFAGHSDKRMLAADVAASVAWSATRGGDAFGLMACDDTIRLELLQAPNRRRWVAEEVMTRLLSCERRRAVRATALPMVAEHLQRARALVFLISDFHFDDTLLRTTLESLSHHDVVPVVLWDLAEYQDLPSWGWARVRDMENGSEQSLFLRPALAERIRHVYAERRLTLAAICRRMGTRVPFFLEERFHAEHLTRHMMETC